MNAGSAIRFYVNTAERDKLDRHRVVAISKRQRESKARIREQANQSIPLWLGAAKPSGPNSNYQLPDPARLFANLRAAVD